MKLVLFLSMFFDSQKSSLATKVEYSPRFELLWTS